MQYKKETPFDQLTLQELCMLMTVMNTHPDINNIIRKSLVALKLHTEILNSISFKEGRYVDTN